MDDKFVYGKAARVSAVIAGHPQWWLVTKWPIEDDTWEEDEIFG